MTRNARPEPPLSASVGEWLGWALPRHGYDLDERGSRARFAEASGIPVATVSRLLRDAGSPDARTLLAVGKTLGVPVMPLLVRAGLVPIAELPDHGGGGDPARPSIPTHDALAALGVTEEADQQAVLSMIRALRAKGESAP
ncbi:helix-turn-helix domain-containing protein [Streptomyces sp. NBC_01718]|uniref:helix-turn-helix domain-containing protein n=1 Tax=Streptomyces sp. NBC_01718 TaxID=2975919 RepID=UPI00352ECDDD